MILTLTYGFFLFFFFLLYWMVVPAKWRAVSLGIASALFFLFSFPAATLLILIMTVLVYGIGIAIYWLEKKKIWLGIGILLTLGVLSYYKYSTWIIETFNTVWFWMNSTSLLPVPELIIPLGISFFTFKFIHYLIDIYRGDIQKASFLQFASYMLFFPTLASGPIERYQTFAKQSQVNLQHFQKEYLYEGIFRIIIGLFKKIVIADAITPFTEGLQTQGLSSVSYWIAAYAYALKIYMDFSGYSDIAIGSARLFGYKIIENFDYPYFRRNLSLFWRHWHISLTTWFRDYVFIPLGGSRTGEWKNLRNIFIVWMATGIWHGAAWHFVLWGIFHALGLIILKYYAKWLYPYVKKWIPNESFLALSSGVLTFHYVVIGWVFFVCDTMQSFYVISHMLLLHKWGG